MKTFEQYLKENKIIQAIVKDIPLGTEIKLSKEEQTYWNDYGGMKKIRFNNYHHKLVGKEYEFIQSDWSNEWYNIEGRTISMLSFFHKSWLDTQSQKVKVKWIPLGTTITLTDKEKDGRTKNNYPYREKLSFTSERKKYSGKTIDIKKTKWSNDWYVYYEAGNSMHFHKSWLEFIEQEELDLDI